MPILLPTKEFKDYAGNDMVFLVTQGRYEVPYLELLTYRESWTQDALSATRTCLCLWEDRYKFKDDMLGTSEYKQGHVVGGIVTGIKRYPPEQHPELEGYMYAWSCELAEVVGVPTKDRRDIAKALSSPPDYSELKQINPESNMVSFNLAQFTVTYTPRDYAIVADEDVPENGFGELNRMVSRYYGPSGENQQIPGAAFRYVSEPANSAGIQEPGAITFPNLELRWVWRQVPEFQWKQTIRNFVGKCNETEFEDQYAPETLVCLPPKVTRYRTAAGDFVYDIEFVFLNRSLEGADWNSLYRKKIGTGQPNAGKPGFEKIIAADGVTKISPLKEFKDLFKLV